MNNELAIQILKEALNIAISKGCFGLVEASNIAKAIEHLENQPNVEFGQITED